jgi:transposase
VNLWGRSGGILFVGYLEMGEIITAKYFVAFIDKLRQQLISKHRGKLAKGTFFLQDNAAPHKATLTHQKFTDLHLEVFKQPAYSPDMTPSDCYLFPHLRKCITRRKAFENREGHVSCERVVCSITSNFSLMGYRRQKNEIITISSSGRNI